MSQESQATFPPQFSMRNSPVVPNYRISGRSFLLGPKLDEYKMRIYYETTRISKVKFQASSYFETTSNDGSVPMGLS